MARKKDTRTVKTSDASKLAKDEDRSAAKAPPKAKAGKAPRPKAAAGKTAAGKTVAGKTVAGKTATGKTAASKAKAKGAKAPVPNRRKPASPAVRTPVSQATSAPVSAKKALKSARAQAKALIADLPVPEMPHVSLPHVPEKVSDSVKAMGNQIASWLNSELGRIMVAELLVYVARQLTDTAGKATGKDAKDAVLKAGAEMGAAAAEAGAQVVKAGGSVTQAGSAFLSAGTTDAGSLVRHVAEAAVGAVGEVVAEVAQKAIARRGKDAPASRKTGKGSGPAMPEG